MECRERQGRLGLQALGGQDRRVNDVSDHGVEQGRLSDARLATHHDTAGGPVARQLDKRVQPCSLGVPADQHARPYSGTTARRQTRPFDRGDLVPGRRAWGHRSVATGPPSDP